MLGSDAFWLILFLDSVECSSCKTAKTNMLRLSAGLRGLASVGYIDCEQPTNRVLCAQCNLPTPPHAPQVLAWRGGSKRENDVGEVGKGMAAMIYLSFYVSNPCCWVGWVSFGWRMDVLGWRHHRR